MNNVVELVVAICSGLAATIPLIVTLVQWIQKAIKEKNWSQVVSFVLDHMMEAEKLYQVGAEKKKYVMSAVITSAASINYTLDEEALSKISAMIDNICTASKTINAVPVTTQ